MEDHTRHSIAQDNDGTIAEDHSRQTTVEGHSEGPQRESGATVGDHAGKWEPTVEDQQEPTEGDLSGRPVFHQCSANSNPHERGRPS